MMRDSNFWALLLLLLLSVIPRNSSANPVGNGLTDSERGVDANMNSQISTNPVDDGIKGAEISEEANISITDVRNSSTNPVGNGLTDAERGEDANMNSQISTNPVADGIKGAEISEEANISITDAEIGEEAMMNSQIARDFMYGTNILKNTWEYFGVNDPSSQFDKDIKQVEIDIVKVPRNLVRGRMDILRGLYYTQDQLKFLRNTLRLSAQNLKRYCNNLLKIYKKFEGRKKQDMVLQYTAKKFVKYATFVKRLLDDALKKTEDINTNLIEVKSFLMDFKANLDEEKIKLEKQQESVKNIKKKRADLEKRKADINNQNEANRKEQLRIIDLTADLERGKADVNRLIEATRKKQRDINIGVCAGTGWFTLGISCLVTAGITDSVLGGKIEDARNKNKALQKTIEDYDAREIQIIKQMQARIDAAGDLEKEIEKFNAREIEIKEQTDRLKIIRPALKSAEELTNGVNTVKTYLASEILLITEWQASLTAAIEIQKELEKAMALKRKEAEMMDGEDLEYMDEFELEMEEDLAKEDIELMKESLTDLIRACDNYLNHNLPGYLQFPETRSSDHSTEPSVHSTEP